MQSSVIEAVPDSMKKILQNIGLIGGPTKPTAEPLKVDLPLLESPSKNSSSLHVFKPHEVTMGDQKQRSKINQLLDAVKLAQEGKKDVKEVQKSINELLESAKRLKNGPDPLNLEDIISAYNHDMKNEVKRQQQDAKKDSQGSELKIVNNAGIKKMKIVNNAGIKRMLVSALHAWRLWVRNIIKGLRTINGIVTNVTNEIHHS